MCDLNIEIYRLSKATVVQDTISVSYRIVQYRIVALT